jgi:hypothetical protein
MTGRLGRKSWQAQYSQICNCLSFSQFVRPRLSLFFNTTFFPGGKSLRGIRQLQGHPVFGVVPSLFRDGLPKLVASLIMAGGDDDIAYCWVGTVTFVVISDPSSSETSFLSPRASC